MQLIYISKIAVCYLESHPVLIPTFPLIQRHHPAWKVPLAGSLKRRARVPLRDNDGWGGGEPGGAGTHSILNLLAELAHRRGEPESQIWGMPWRDGWAWGLGGQEEAPLTPKDPVLSLLATQMRPDVLTLLRFSPSSHTHTHSHHSCAPPPLNHNLSLTCPLSFPTVPVSFDVNISKYQIIKVGAFRFFWGAIKLHYMPGDGTANHAKLSPAKRLRRYKTTKHLMVFLSPLNQ